MAVIGNLFNKNRINLGQALPLATPLVVQLETSGFCNFKCFFCPCGVDTSGALIKDMMTLETFNLFLEQCKSFPEKIKALRIIGIGEPLLNKHLPDFVAAAKRANVFDKVEITTNGMLLTPTLSDALIAAGLDTLIVSLEAVDEERFFEIAGVHADIKALFDNFKYFYEHRGNCLLYIKTTDYAFMKENEKEKFISEYGEICDSIYVESIIENWPGFSVGTDGDSVRYDMEQYKSKKQVCVQPFKLLCLAANGDIMPCSVDWKRELKLGNIHETALLDLWNGEKMRVLRAALLKHNVYDYCKLCSYTKSNQPDDIDAYSEEILGRIFM